MLFNVNVSMKEQLKAEKGFFSKLFKKLILCYNIIKEGDLKFDGLFIFRGRNHIVDFADMITLLSKEVQQESTELIELRKELRKLRG